MNGHVENINWQAIVGKIRKQKAILVLGPEAYTGDDGRSLQQRLLENLNVPENPHIQKHYVEDDFFLFSRGGGRAFICEHIDAFYRERSPGEQLRQLARIPFHIMLTVTPDKLLPKTFDELDFRYQFDFQKKHAEPSAVTDPSAAFPLIYNLFGCIDDEESLVLTHNDLYDYFKSIFSHRSMPERVKHALQNREVNCFLFLGVPFEKWYLQLILRELDIHRYSEDFILYAANQSLTEDIKTFCTEQFTINFVENNIPRFVDRLHRECADAGILRQAPDQDRWTKLRSLIADGDLEKAINIFLEVSEGSDLKDEVIGLSGRFRRFQRKKNQGVLSADETAIQENKISSSLLELVEEVRGDRGF